MRIISLVGYFDGVRRAETDIEFLRSRVRGLDDPRPLLVWDGWRAKAGMITI